MQCFKNMKNTQLDGYFDDIIKNLKDQLSIFSFF